MLLRPQEVRKPLAVEGFRRHGPRPEVLPNSPIDDRDAGILETPSGSLLVTTFTSPAYETALARRDQASRRRGHWLRWERA
jgi:hypothetical protein